jgi:hypothetical protein
MLAGLFKSRSSQSERRSRQEGRLLNSPGMLVIDLTGEQVSGQDPQNLLTILEDLLTQLEKAKRGVRS